MVAGKPMAAVVAAAAVATSPHNASRRFETDGEVVVVITADDTMDDDVSDCTKFCGMWLLATLFVDWKLWFDDHANVGTTCCEQW